MPWRKICLALSGMLEKIVVVDIGSDVLVDPSMVAVKTAARSIWSRH